MRKLATPALTVLLLAGAGTALAEDAKPAAPLLSDVLTASGLTATGYVDGTYSYVSASPSGGSSVDTNTFGLNQASITLAYAPAAGFGATVQAVAGTEAGNGCYAAGYLPCVDSSNKALTTSSFNLLQAFAQYVSGKTTLYVGKFTTLAGAEVAAPTGNTNVTRSLLFWYSEPVTHIGARVAYAATDTLTVTGGVNNGWNNDYSTSGKAYEFGATYVPSKAYTIAGSVYYTSKDSTTPTKTLVDVVSTWNATSAVTVIVNLDYDTVDVGSTTAKWYGGAAYLNYAISDAWRLSVRGEYLDDKDGYATTGSLNPEIKVTEGTLTFGYAPAKPFELRLEGRYDTYKPTGGSSNDLTQLWVQALYKF
jgi:hypothetical protein